MALLLAGVAPMIHRSSSDLHFRQITTLLRRRWLLILVFGLIGGAAAVGFGKLSVPLYTAKAQLLYDAEVKDGVVTTEADAGAAVETMVEMLLSPSHIRRLAESLEADPPAATPEPNMEEDGAGSDAAGEAPRPVADLSYDGLELGLNAYKERQSRLVAVTFTTTDPATAAEVANRATDLYLDVETSYQRDQRARALRATVERIPEARAELDRAESALREHRIEFGLTDATVSDLTDRQIADLNRQLMVDRSELAAREAEIIRLGGATAQSDAGSATGLGDGSRPMRLAVTPTAVNRDDATGFGADRGRLTPSRADALAGARLNRDAIKGRIDDIEGRLSTLRHASAQSTQSWARLDELEREAGAAGQIYENLLRRQDDLLNQGLPRPSARLVTTALIPGFPSSPSPMLFVAPAVVAALLLGGMIAVILERLDQRLRTEADVEEGVGARCIGAVPRVARLHGARLLRFLRDQPFAAYTEAIRGIFVASMRQSERGSRSTTLLVTSCARGNGKTTLLASLAVYAAQLGRPVLVIDFDFRHPGVEQVLGEPDDPVVAPPAGNPLSSLLPEARIRRSRAFGVDYVLLPDGRVDPLSVLESEAFPQALSQLKEAYACVMIDSGAILDAPETRLLASVADHVILAVRWGVTDIAAAQAAVQRLRATGSDFSLVISQVRRARGYNRAALRTPTRATI